MTRGYFQSSGFAGSYRTQYTTRAFSGWAGTFARRDERTIKKEAPYAIFTEDKEGMGGAVFCFIKGRTATKNASNARPGGRMWMRARFKEFIKVSGRQVLVLDDCVPQTDEQAQRDRR